MSAWKYRLIAVICGLLGASLIGLVWRAMYFTDLAADRLMFEVGMPLILLSTLCGGLLVGAAGLLFVHANHWRLRQASRLCHGRDVRRPRSATRAAAAPRPR